MHLHFSTCSYFNFLNFFFNFTKMFKKIILYNLFELKFKNVKKLVILKPFEA